MCDDAQSSARAREMLLKAVSMVTYGWRVACIGTDTLIPAHSLYIRIHITVFMYLY